MDIEELVTPSRVCELKSEPVYVFSVVLIVTPSRVCELKYFVWQGKIYSLTVTPSRVCELKSKKSISWAST